jgi:ribose-phosphate pyrophosphokinase
MNVVGEVSDNRVLLVDDLVDTAGTITNAANALVAMGAEEVYACCTHGVFSGSACERIENSMIKEMVVLNTIPLPKGKPVSKIKQLSVATLFSEAIERIYGDISISTLFD